MRSEANKPLFIITPVGEFGPFTSDEILRQVNKGEILRSDRLRTSDGQLIGTVSDIESGRIRVVVSPGSRVGGGSDPASKRISSSPRQVSASSRQPRANSQPSMIVAGILAAVSVAIVVLVMWSGSAAKPKSPVALPANTSAGAQSANDLPAIALTLGERRPGMTEVLVTSDQRLDSSLTVRVGMIGDTGGVRLEPADGRVVLGKGTASGKLTVLTQGDADGVRAVRLLLATSDGYAAAGGGALDVKVEPAIPVVVKPTIAWESFAYSDVRALQQGEGSFGWSTRWSGDGAVTVAAPLAMPADFSGAAPPAGHLLIESRGNKAIFLWRQLSQRLTNGTVWVSCLMQGRKRSDDETDWAALGFEDGTKSGGFSIAVQCFKTRTQWLLNAPHPDDKGRPKYQLNRAADISIPVRMVVRLDLSATAANLSYWLNPAVGREPQRNPADHMETVAPICFERVTLYASKNSALSVADLRLGRTWQEVLPAR